MHLPKKLQIVIIDDSRVSRTIIERAVNADPNLKIKKSYGDVSKAISDLKIEQPDCILLDLEMPRITGYDFLKISQTFLKAPVIVVSRLVEEGNDKAQEVMNLGAQDSITKPAVNNDEEFAIFSEMLALKIKTAVSLAR